MIITVQWLTELKPQYIYELSTSDHLLSELINVAVGFQINHRSPRVFYIPILYTAHSRVYFPIWIFGVLEPIKKTVQKLVKHHGQKSQMQKKIPWKTQRKYLNTYSQPYWDNHVFSPKLAIVLNNVWYLRMFKSPRRYGTNLHPYYKPNIWLHSVNIIYRHGNNQLDRDGCSNHRNPPLLANCTQFH